MRLQTLNILPRDKPQVANFFWHGAEINPYTYACIASFLKHGFDCRVWSYQALKLPLGVSLYDAGLVLPKEFIDKCEQAGKRPSLACFSDFFRYKLLSEHEGWWFDTDVLCLKNESEFFFPHDKNIVGFEDGDSLNGAVLKLDKIFAANLFERACELGEEKNWAFSWGDVGPSLITEELRKTGKDEFLGRPRGEFYPIHYSEWTNLVSPEKLVSCQSACSNALTCHYWNEMFARAGLNRELLPPKKSFLHEMFVFVAPEIASLRSASPREIERIIGVELTKTLSAGQLINIVISRLFKSPMKRVKEIQGALRRIKNYIFHFSW